jgi:hypothetical protein
MERLLDLFTNVGLGCGFFYRSVSDEGNKSFKGFVTWRSLAGMDDEVRFL